MIKIVLLAAACILMTWDTPALAGPFDYTARCRAVTVIYATDTRVVGQGKGKSSRRRKAVRKAERNALANCRAQVQRIGDRRGYRQRRINRIASRCEVRRRCRIKKPIIDWRNLFD